MSESRATATDHARRLAALRAHLAAHGLAGFVVPHADENQSEYLPPSAERLRWLTGFSGSAGAAIVLTAEAAVFVDGRYTLQVRGETDPANYAFEHLVDNPPAKWLATHVKAGDRIGYDPWLMTVAEVRHLAGACEEAGAEFVPVAANPIDAIWTDRPEAPTGPVSLHPIEFAGEAAQAKLLRLQSALADAGADATVLTHAEFDCLGAQYPRRGHRA